MSVDFLGSDLDRQWYTFYQEWFNCSKTCTASEKERYDQYLCKINVRCYCQTS